MTTPCQAVIDDNDNFAVHAPRQGIMAPGNKPCPRGGRGNVGHLCLCKVHERMALEGLIDETGRVAPRADIANVRKYPTKFPHGLNTWQVKVTSE